MHFYTDGQRVKAEIHKKRKNRPSSHERPQFTQRCTTRFKSQEGQASVEAAFLIPLMFVLLLLLIQPGILLYNQMVMLSAASEGCRLLATQSESSGASYENCEAFIKRRLGSIPSQENFHIHEGECSWEISFVGDEKSETVEVTITNHLKFLPLFDLGGSLLRFYDSSGSFCQSVTVSLPTQPTWVAHTEVGRDPSAWVEHWSL